MSTLKKVPYISLRDIVVPTLDGYTVRFVKNVTTHVPNTRNVIKAVQAAGCVPVEDDAEAPKLKTIEDLNDDEVEKRKLALFAALDVIVERNEPTDFTNAGVPQTNSLETISGFQVSVTERNKVWKEFKAERGMQ